MSTTTLQDKATHLAERGMDAAHDGALQLRDRALDASDATVRYIQTQPFKAVMIAAASGAALMAVFNMLSHSRKH